MDTKLLDLEGAFGTKIGLSKAERLATGDSAMTHAMVLTAVHLDASCVPFLLLGRTSLMLCFVCRGKSVRWRVENSWGVEACDKGFMLMSDHWFEEHVFQIVADRKKVPAHLVKVFEHGTAVELPPWVRSLSLVVLRWRLMLCSFAGSHGLPRLETYLFILASSFSYSSLSCHYCTRCCCLQSNLAFVVSVTRAKALQKEKSTELHRS